MDGKHLALVGFMGAGKSTLGWQLAARIGAPLTDVDADLEGLVGPIPDYFDKHGEADVALVERSDVSAVEALAVVAEAAVAWELAVAARDKFGGDAIGDFVAAWRAYLGRIPWQPHTR